MAGFTCFVCGDPIKPSRAVELPGSLFYHEGLCEPGSARFMRNKRLAREYMSLFKRSSEMGNVSGSVASEKPVKAVKTPKKVSRKAKTAGPSKTKKMTVREAVVKVLSEAGEPLGCNQIHARIVDGGLFEFHTKTPYGTIWNVLKFEIKKGTAQKAGRGRFTMVG